MRLRFNLIKWLLIESLDPAVFKCRMANFTPDLSDLLIRLKRNSKHRSFYLIPQLYDCHHAASINRAIAFDYVT